MKCGPDGGWYLGVEYNGEKYDFENILGYNVEEVMEEIERLPDYSKAGDSNGQNIDRQSSASPSSGSYP